MRTRITPNTDTFYALFGNVRWQTLIGKNNSSKLNLNLIKGLTALEYSVVTKIFMT